MAWNFHRNEKLITMMKSNLRRAKSVLWNIVDEFKFEHERIRLVLPLCFLNQSSGYIFHACLFTELEDVVIVIQSQRNSYHARRSGQRKVEILQQAARLGQVTSGMLCYNPRSYMYCTEGTLSIVSIRKYQHSSYVIKICYNRLCEFIYSDNE